MILRERERLSDGFGWLISIDKATRTITRGVRVMCFTLLPRDGRVRPPFLTLSFLEEEEDSATTTSST